MSERESKDAHPIVRELEWRIGWWSKNGPANVKVEEAVLKHGRPFIGITRPKDYRQRAKKRCFVNAGALASAERGIYVEGFAMKDNFVFHRAWITLDGIHAIDVTLTDPASYSYFGIPFALEVLGDWLVKRGQWGLLDALDKDTEELLTDAHRRPVKF